MKKIFTLKNLGLLMVSIAGTSFAGGANDDPTVHGILSFIGMVGTVILKFS